MTILYVPEEHSEPVKAGCFFGALSWVVSRVLPAASPDYDKHWEAIAYWLVEVNDQGAARREIAFNAQHQPILFAPTNRNYGLWTDSDRVFVLEEFNSRNEFPFDATWNQLYAQTLQGARPL